MSTWPRFCASCERRLTKIMKDLHFDHCHACCAGH